MRKWIRILHRDVGYFLCGLTILYAISGVAVNHIDSWNPSYSTSVEAVSIGPLRATTLDGLEREALARLPVDPAEIRGRHRPNPRDFVLFLPHGGEARLAVATGEGTITRFRPRPVLFQANVLHLNHLKGIWTWVADVFAILLLGLAATGIFILRGRQGLAGRGKWFLAAGIILPVAFLAIYYAGL